MTSSTTNHQPPASPLLSSENRASLMLLIAVLFWGLSFPLMKEWQDASKTCPGGEVVSGLTVIGLRMFLALLVFAVILPSLFYRPSRREFGIGVFVGFVNWVGFALQAIGVASTTPALSGFFTSLACLWVPILVWICFRQRVARTTWLALALGLAGAALLGVKFDQKFSIGFGEQLTLIASVLFAVTVLLLDRLGKSAAPGHLAVGFIGVTGVASFAIVGACVVFQQSYIAYGNWLVSMLLQPRMLLNLGLLTLLCTVISFLWMTVYQPRVPATRAALIYLTEPVFAYMFSLMWGLDQLTLPLIAGGALILSGNFLAELPLWWRRRKIESAKLQITNVPCSRDATAERDGLSHPVAAQNRAASHE